MCALPAAFSESEEVAISWSLAEYPLLLGTLPSHSGIGQGDVCWLIHHDHEIDAVYIRTFW